ncbi:hypothetical protein AGMMS49992_09120 [Clostridia bacterium]|nr:hypothetical protein AGMMS49992_09120 [Clostridia bacterium]
MIQQCMATAINRATPSKEEISQVFGEKVTADTVILCEGNNSYDVLEGKCTVAHTKRVNKVNGFHSYIKERLLAARGVATIYLNWYNTLFSQIYGNREAVADKIYELMTSRDGSFSATSTVKSQNLLAI